MITDISMVYLIITISFCRDCFVNSFKSLNLFLLIPNLMYSLPFDLSILLQIFQVRLCSINMPIVISWNNLTTKDAPSIGFKPFYTLSKNELRLKVCMALISVSFSLNRLTLMRWLRPC